MAERIITLGRRGNLHARRQAAAFLYDTAVVKKVFDEIGPRMKDRPGGYLRITGVEPRKGDGARMASIELMGYVDAAPTPRPNRVTAAPAVEAPAPRTRGRRAAAPEVEAVAEAVTEVAAAEVEAPVEAEAPAEAEAQVEETPTDAPEAEGEKA